MGELLAVAQDEYGDVLNRSQTYDFLADRLLAEGRWVIGWTDELGSHLDILLALRPGQSGYLQRGLRGRRDLFVAIVGLGAHGFELRLDLLPTAAGYYGEKFRLGDNETTQQLAYLINALRERLSDA